MSGVVDFWLSIRLFIDTGGWVLWGIMAVSLWLWALIIARYWYVWLQYPLLRDQQLALWQSRDERNSWFALRVREQLISEASVALNKQVRLIKTLVAVAPLFGLLGTVTGMVQVFDVVARQGTGDAQAMAAGVSKATIPTMAGMVVALSGLYFGNRLQQMVRQRTRQLADSLSIA